MTTAVAPAKHKQAVLLDIGKGGRMRWFRFGGVERFVPTHRRALNSSNIVCSLFVLI
jgi:hypothetical protein